MPKDGGFNHPLRGHKATVWEGGVRSHTILHWTGLSPRLKGTIWSGLAHVADWGIASSEQCCQFAQRPLLSPLSFCAERIHSAK